jgi:hypothetical protein
MFIVDQKITEAGVDQHTTEAVEEDPRYARVLRSARRLFHRRPGWIVFFRRILGPDGVAHHLFPTRREFQEFERSEAYGQIQSWLTRLWEEEPTPAKRREPTRMITVRLPSSMHEALRLEAYQRATSMNKLCISKLLQFIEDELIPREKMALNLDRRKDGANDPPSEEKRRE